MKGQKNTHRTKDGRRRIDKTQTSTDRQNTDELGQKKQGRTWTDTDRQNKDELG